MPDFGWVVLALGTLASSKPVADGREIEARYDDGRIVSIGQVEKPVERELLDVQYGTKERFRGFDLAPVVTAGRARNSDLAVLRFDNGMIIPLALDRLPKIFVATGVWDARTERWTAPPPAKRKHKIYDDLRPIVFAGNKVVVEVTAEGFTPWRHTGSLVAIEHTTKAKWREPVDAGRAFSRGRKLFEARCQFCHGVGGHGASHGWDFIDPIPVTEYRRTPGRLQLHVNHRVSNAMELGLMMPAIGTLDEDDAMALWTWIDAIARKYSKD